MTTRLTRDILESFLTCKFKGHLKLIEQQGTKSDYDLLLAAGIVEVRRRAVERILARCEQDTVVRSVALTPSILRRGPLFILDATLGNDALSFDFDALKRTDGPSKVGEFHYVPMLFHGGRRVGKVQRLLLDIYGFLLSRIQGRAPGRGIVFRKPDYNSTTIRLNPDPRKTERLLRELIELKNSQSPPTLILNDHCSICEFRQQCHKQAVQEDSLSLLRSMGEKEIKSAARKGILTVTQLAHTFRPRRKGKRSPPRKKRYHALQAMAVRDKRIYVLGSPQIPNGRVNIFLDMEGIPEERFVYLIGMIVADGCSETTHSFWADTKEQEAEILQQFLKVVEQHEGARIFSYGSFEKEFFKRMRLVADTMGSVDKILHALVNTLTVIHSHVYFPTHGNGLKEIAGLLGYKWANPDSSGIQSIVWRKWWEQTGDDQWKRQLLQYNIDDCAALRTVTNCISTVVLHDCRGTEPLKVGSPSVPVSSVVDFDRLTSFRKWGTVAFVHPDYKYINDCAYFDYQRDKVFVRTSRVLRRTRTQRAKKTNGRLRVSRRVELTASECPSCFSKDLAVVSKGMGRPRGKRAFDLLFTAGGNRRSVIECRSSLYECLPCGHRFIPAPYRRLEKHFHGLKSWAMFQHVFHGLSLHTIEDMFGEFFGLHVFNNEILMLKSLMRQYYEPTSFKCLRRILAGNVLHVDETEVKLRSGKGYVWVLTNVEEVVFMFRPTREGDFLHELLQEFHGVLVSDFYSVYDSVKCPQQKCLIHLIRDINQELLNSPFDEELQAVTRPFGTLLRAVVSTADRHGLKARHLRRHEGRVARFFQNLHRLTVHSEAAEALQDRLLRLRDKLFTFLRFDGVPWNNNNAENAIKRFAYYRERTIGTMTEAGLKDYLVLLSVCQTCRFKGISFLKFLLSRETDIDVFCESRRHKVERPEIEMYPEGFIPPIRKADKAMNKASE
jgi:predicted RecB family nuclease